MIEINAIKFAHFFLCRLDMKDVEEFQHNAIALNGLSVIEESGEFSLSKAG